MTGILSKAACALTLGALALGATMQTAQAQSTSETSQKPFAVKIGLYTPVNKEVRTASGNYVGSIEGDVTIQRFPEKSSVSLFSIGYLERSGLRLIPITVSQIFRDPNNPSGRNYYYGLGFGIYSSRLDRGDTSGRIKNLLGGFGVVGLELSKSYFVEGKYHIISRYDNKNLNGVQVSLGLRF